jgi:hypothetical protein
VQQGVARRKSVQVWGFRAARYSLWARSTLPRLQARIKKTAEKNVWLVSKAMQNIRRILQSNRQAKRRVCAGQLAVSHMRQEDKESL